MIWRTMHVDDFSASAMMRLIAAGLKAEGVTLPRIRLNPGAHVSLAKKRALLQSLFDQLGGATIFRLGDAISSTVEEPALTALLAASDPPDMLKRWQRMERYLHSNHRIEWEPLAPDLLRLRHVNKKGPSAPILAESLLVFGLITALTERVGGKKAWARCSHHGQNLRNDESWQHNQPALADRKRGAEILLSYKQVERPQPEELKMPTTADRWAAKIQDRITTDPCRHWTLSILARDLATSPRTLQRRLECANTNFSTILREARVANAAKLLCHSSQSLSEIGFVCGFSDQAHFNRQFKNSTALTPATYRDDFARAV